MLDRVIAVVGMTLFVTFVVLRLLVFRVRIDRASLSSDGRPQWRVRCDHFAVRGWQRSTLVHGYRCDIEGNANRPRGSPPSTRLPQTADPQAATDSGFMYQRRHRAPASSSLRCLGSRHPRLICGELGPITRARPW
jgi:hypothetical protein